MAINLKAYFIESVKISGFALLLTLLFKLLGAPDDMVVIMFAMVVMSSAATFSIDRKHISHIALGAFVVIASLILGGVAGDYELQYAPFFVTIYAGLAFYLPHTLEKIIIFMIGSVMFLIFTYLPFDWEHALHYSLGGLFVFITFVPFFWLTDHTKGVSYQEDRTIKGQEAMATVAVVSLSIGWVIAYFLKQYTTVSHLYWVPLTSLVVIQCSQAATIKTSIKRIVTNVVGAIIIVFLLNYVIPDNFTYLFSMLVLFLFMIFFLSFSYVGRTLFIEMFVLGFSHILGNFQGSVEFDRVLLTIIGGLVVLVVTPVVYKLTEEN